MAPDGVGCEPFWGAHVLLRRCVGKPLHRGLYGHTLPGANLELFRYRWGLAGVAWPAERALSSYGD